MTNIKTTPAYPLAPPTSSNFQNAHALIIGLNIRMESSAQPRTRILESEEEEKYPLLEDDPTLWSQLYLTETSCTYCNAPAVIEGHIFSQRHLDRKSSLKDFRDRYRKEIHPLLLRVEKWISQYKPNSQTIPRFDETLQFLDLHRNNLVVCIIDFG